MLDNKFLKHPGMGVKLLLPIELERRTGPRRTATFHQRARLDKQNLIRSLAWTGQSLYDLANARLEGLRGRAAVRPTMADLFEPTIDDAAAEGRAWRRCACRGTCSSSCIVSSPPTATPTATSSRSGRFPAATFESVLALYQRDQDAFDRGVGAG